MTLFGFATAGQKMPTPSDFRNAAKGDATPHFKVNYNKLIQAIHVIATAYPGITHYFLGKALFKADREHVLDYGLPITGGTYRAYKHGPFAEEAIELVKREFVVSTEIANALEAHVEIHRDKTDSKRFVISPKTVEAYPDLSEEQVDYLRQAASDMKGKSFAEVERDTHDEAWEEARTRGEKSIIDTRIWLKGLDDPEKAIEQFSESVQLWS